MKELKVHPKRVSEAYDFVLLPRVQKTGSYRVLKSKLEKQGAASFPYRHSYTVTTFALSRPRACYSYLDDEVTNFLASKLSKLHHGRRPPFKVNFIISRWDMMKDACVVVVWKRGYKMTPRLMRELSKKPLRPTELL